MIFLLFCCVGLFKTIFIQVSKVLWVWLPLISSIHFLCSPVPFSPLCPLDSFVSIFESSVHMWLCGSMKMSLYKWEKIHGIYLSEANSMFYSLYFQNIIFFALSFKKTVREIKGDFLNGSGNQTRKVEVDLNWKESIRYCQNNFMNVFWNILW